MTWFVTSLIFIHNSYDVLLTLLPLLSVWLTLIPLLRRHVIFELSVRAPVSLQNLDWCFAAGKFFSKAYVRIEVFIPIWTITKLINENIMIVAFLPFPKWVVEEFAIIWNATEFKRWVHFTHWVQATETHWSDPQNGRI